jgi:hypothetical protein
METQESNALPTEFKNIEQWIASSCPFSIS